MKKPTILIIPYTPTLSHISRPLEIAKVLRKKGWHIQFAGYNTNRSKLSFIEAEGFKCLDLYEPDPDILFEHIRKGDLAFVSRTELIRMIQADISLFRRVKPDLVLSDGRFSAMISTQICNIPHAAIVNASSTEYRSIPYIPLFERAFKRIKSKGFHRLCDFVNLKLEMMIFDYSMKAFTQLSKKFNLKTRVTATNCLAGKDITLLSDIPEYFPVKDPPDSYHYIGPITWKPPGSIPDPSWWSQLESRTLIVYITMGTTGENNLFLKVYNQFRNSELVSIVTTGSQADHFKTIPGRIYVENYMDGEKVLGKSDLVICHGGNGTIYQALSLAKPVIGIPTIPDQDFNMRRVEALGLGIRVPMTEALKNPSILVEKTRYIMSHKDQFAPNLARIQKHIKSYQGDQLAAEIIQRYIERLER